MDILRDKQICETCFTFFAIILSRYYIKIE